MFLDDEEQARAEGAILLLKETDNEDRDEFLTDLLEHVYVDLRAQNG